MAKLLTKKLLTKQLERAQARYKQLKGKMRRFFLCAFRKKYVAITKLRRDGECARCGQCCKLVIKCPFLRQEGEQTKCVIYGFRLTQCKRFPIDERDIREVDNSTCGYRF